MQKREGLLRGPLEEVEIQRKALKREKLGPQQQNMFRKGKSAVEDDPKKSWSWIETEAGVELEEIGMEVGLVGIHWEEEGLTFAWIERKTPVLRPALQ